MPFDVIAFGEATPGTGTPNIAAVAGDQLYKTAGDDITIRAQATHLLGALGFAASTGGRFRLKQPSQSLYYEFIKCCLQADNDPSEGFTNLLGRPLPLFPNEKLNASVGNATDEQDFLAAFVGNGKITQAMLDSINPTHCIVGTTPTDLVANTWTTLTMTWNQDLPVGRYAIVGMKAGLFKSSGPGLGVVRVVLSEPAGAAWRPGVPAAVIEGVNVEFQSIPDDVPFWKWPLMPEIVFPHDKLPGIEAVSGIAMTDAVIELLLQKVG